MASFVKVGIDFNSMTQHEVFLRRTFELARQGEGRVEPNPLVGAVLVRKWRIIAEGAHRVFGGPHAEENAFMRAKGDVRGATLYVNLEPCAHYGKRPPCTDLIIREGISHVVIATKDPNPLVHGRGIAALRRAGICFTSGILANEARRLNAYFFKFHTQGLPYVYSKWAMSIDGKIATRTGDSRWISSEASRAWARSFRHKVQAVVIGIETALADDPQLLGDNTQARQPIRVVLDSRARLPLSARLVRTARRIPTLAVVSAEAPAPKIRRLREAGCEVVSFTPLRLTRVLRFLAERGIAKVLIEGGGEVHASAFEERVVDEVLVFVAPKIIGGREAKTAVEGEGVAWLADALSLRECTFTRIDEDVLIRGIF